MNRLAMALVASLLAAPPASAQAPSTAGSAPAGRALAAALDTYYQGIRRNFLEGAEHMPEEKYAFRPGPMPEVFTFARLVGHVAYNQYVFCSSAKGESNPNASDVDFQALTTKASLIDALKTAFAYCDAVYGTATDAMLLAPRSATNSRPRVMWLVQNASHTNEHYGNMVTYYRLNGMVPPSTLRAQEAPPRQ